MGETEGGMSSGTTGGFSTAGTSPTSSSAAEPAPPTPLGFDPEGAIIGPIPIPQSIIHVVSSVAEAAHLVESGGLTPILIVPPQVLPGESTHEAEFDTDTDDDGIEG